MAGGVKDVAFMRVKQDDDIIIDFGVLFRYLLQRIGIILLSGVVGGAFFYGISAFCMVPQYRSQTMLYVLTKATSITSFAEIQIGSALTMDLLVISMSNPVLDGAIKNVADRHDIALTRSEITEMVQVSNKADTRILVISATSPDPELSSIVANAVGEETAKQMAFILKTDLPTTIEEAEPDSDPVSPGILKNTLSGAGLFLFLSAGILGVLCVFNDKVKTAKDVEDYLGLKVLAVIPDEEIFKEYRKPAP